ncbi:MAG: hypothetical protein NVSMB27_27880 [Ktedonobacteraceae bacterium]
MGSDLPPLSRAGMHGPSVCATVRLYLAVLHDVSPLQRQLLQEHVNSCTSCLAELRMLSGVAPLATDSAEFTPPPRVDRAVMAAIEARGLAHRQMSTVRLIRRQHSPWLMLCAAVVVVMVAVMGTLQLLGASFSPSRAFTLPAHLSWCGSVLYYTETTVGANGVQYYIHCYHDLGMGLMHVETTAGNDLDIVAVGNEHELLGEDLIHHIAQWGADAWGVDDSLFNVGQLRADLQASRAVYLGRETFQGQEVYRIRMRNGLVLLLDMRR